MKYVTKITWAKLLQESFTDHCYNRYKRTKQYFIARPTYISIFSYPKKP